MCARWVQPASPPPARPPTHPARTDDGLGGIWCMGGEAHPVLPGAKKGGGPAKEGVEEGGRQPNVTLTILSLSCVLAGCCPPATTSTVRTVLHCFARAFDPGRLIHARKPPAQHRSSRPPSRAQPPASARHSFPAPAAALSAPHLGLSAFCAWALLCVLGGPTGPCNHDRTSTSGAWGGGRRDMLPLGAASAAWRPMSI